MNEVNEKIISRIFALCRVTPIMESFNTSILDSIFVHLQTSHLIENSIHSFKLKKDKILP